MKFFYISVLILMTNLLHSQGHQLIYPGSGITNTFTSIQFVDNKLICTGTDYLEEIDNRAFSITVFDTLLNLLDTNLIVDPSGSFFSTINTDVLTTSTNKIVAVGHLSGGQTGFSLSFDSSLDQVFYETNFNPEARTLFQNNITEVEGGYVIVSDIQLLNWENQFWAMKLDHDGNELWYREYGAIDTSETVADIATLPSGEVTIVGRKSNLHEISSPNDIYWARAWQAIIDPENGDLLSSQDYHIEEEFEQYASIIEPLSDGGDIRASAMLTDAPEPYNARLLVRKMDSERQVVWETPYGPHYVNGRFAHYDILPFTEDKYYVVSRAQTVRPVYPTPGVYAIVTAAFNPQDGSLYWSRADTLVSDTLSQRWNRPQGATVLPSGSLVVAGFNTSGRSYGWLHKIDQNGCLSETDCAMPVSSGEVVLPEAVVRVYPNPAREQVFFAGLPPASRLRIFNGRGQQLFEDVPQTDRVVYPVAQLSAGAYFYLVDDKEGAILDTGKFIVD